MPPTIGPTDIGTRGPIPVAILPNCGESRNSSSEIGVVAKPASRGV
jgi:hypothetical protein